MEERKQDELHAKRPIEGMLDVMNSRKYIINMISSKCYGKTLDLKWYLQVHTLFDMYSWELGAFSWMKHWKKDPKGGSCQIL